MVKKNEYIGWNREDRDLLVELKTEMVALREDVKDLKDGVKMDIEFLKADKISRAEAVRINTDQQVINQDVETRMRTSEKKLTQIITWGSAGVLILGIIQFLVGKFL